LAQNLDAPFPAKCRRAIKERRGEYHRGGSRKRLAETALLATIYFLSPIVQPGLLVDSVEPEEEFDTFWRIIRACNYSNNSLRKNTYNELKHIYGRYFYILS